MSSTWSWPFNKDTWNKWESFKLDLCAHSSSHSLNPARFRGRQISLLLHPSFWGQLCVSWVYGGHGHLSEQWDTGLQPTPSSNFSLMRGSLKTLTLWRAALKFVWLRELKKGLCISLEGWDGEGGSIGREHMYTCGWVILMFDRKQQNSVKQLSSIKK